MSGNAGIYGRRQGAKYGINFSDAAVSDNAETTIAETGQIVLDLTTGELSYVDTNTKTQTLS